MIFPLFELLDAIEDYSRKPEDLQILRHLERMLLEAYENTCIDYQQQKEKQVKSISRRVQ